MSEQKMMQLSEMCSELYGISAATREAIANYGKALLVIAGSDGAVSNTERQWMMDHMRKMGTAQEILDELGDYDFRSADLTDLLPSIKADIETYVPGSHLVYHAIQMCSADGEYTDTERAKVFRAARAMNVADDIVLTLHALVKMEEAVYEMRSALIHTDVT